MSKKAGLPESTLVKIIVVLAAMVILIAVLVVARENIGEGIKSFFGAWR